MSGFQNLGSNIWIIPGYILCRALTRNLASSLLSSLVLKAFDVFFRVRSIYQFRDEPRSSCTTLWGLFLQIFPLHISPYCCSQPFPHFPDPLSTNLGLCYPSFAVSFPQLNLSHGPREQTENNQQRVLSVSTPHPAPTTSTFWTRVPMVREDPFLRNACLTIAAIDAHSFQAWFCLEAMAGERGKNAGDFSHSLSCPAIIPFPSPPTHTHSPQTQKRRCFSWSLFFSCLVYISGIWAAFDPGWEVGRKENNQEIAPDCLCFEF